MFANRSRFIASSYLITFAMGFYYTFAIISNDIKQLQLYSQTQINFLGGATYFFPMCCVYFLPKLDQAFGSRKINIAANVSYLCGWIGLLIFSYQKVNFFLFALFLVAMSFGGVFSWPSTLTLLDSWVEKTDMSFHIVFLSIIYASVGGFVASVYQGIGNTAHDRFSRLGFIGIVSGFFSLLASLFFIDKNSAEFVDFEPDETSFNNNNRSSQILTPRSASATPIYFYSTMEFQSGKKHLSAFSSQRKRSSLTYGSFSNHNGHIEPIASPTPSKEPVFGDLNHSPKKNSSEIPKTFLFWVIWFNLFLGFGLAIGFYHNIGPILASRNGTKLDLSLSFVIYSFGQILGRFFIGNTIHHFSERSSRPLAILSTSALVMSVVLTLIQICNFFFFTPIFFYCIVFFSSMIHGGLCLLPTFCSFSFSSLLFSSFVSNQEQLYGFYILTEATGPLVFDMFSGMLYDQHTNSQNQCYGSQCYSLYFFIAFWISLINNILAACWVFLVSDSEFPPQNTSLTEELPSSEH